MLRLTREAEYGLLAISYIASRPDGELSFRREIAQHHNIPREFLAKVLQKLTKHGLIRSYRGIRGGYLLARPMEQITLSDIVRAVDGPMALVECARKDGDCPQFDACELKDALHELQDGIVHLLESMSLEDLTSRMRKKRGGPIAVPGQDGARAGRGAEGRR
jgi:Rrf2 family protein